MKDKQLYKEGDVIKVGGTELECSFVTWRNRDGGKENFVYSFRLKSEMDAERKATNNESKE